MKHSATLIIALHIVTGVIAQPADYAKSIMRALLTDANSEAIALSNEAISAYPDSARFYYYHGKAMQEQQHYPKAKESFQQALRLDSTNRMYQKALGRLYFTKSHYQRAEEIFRSLFQADSTNIDAGIYLTRSLLKRKAYNQALGYYRILNRRQPDNPYFKRYIGFCLYKQDKKEEALSWFNQTLALDSNAVNAYQYKARIYSHLDSIDRALATVNKGLEFFPRNADLYEIKGRLFRDMRNFEGVANAYQNAWDLKAQTPDNAKNLGSSYFQSQQYDRAINYLRKLEGNDQSVLVLWTLGQSYLQKQESDSALFFMKKAYRSIKPDYRIYRDMMKDLASSFLANRQYKKAIGVHQELADNKHAIPEAYRPAVKAGAFIAIADIYDRHLNSPKNALKWYKKAETLKTHIPPKQETYVAKKIRRLKEQEFFEQ